MEHRSRRAKQVGRAIGGAYAALAVALILPAACARSGAATTWKVGAGQDLQAVIDKAVGGDTILVAAGATFVGPFRLPAKAGSEYITIRTDARDTELPAEAHRIGPSYSNALPKLVSPGSNLPALTTKPGAHHWRLVGLEFAPEEADTACTELVQLGDGNATQNSLALVPHDFVLDRCYVHSLRTNNWVRRGICLQCAQAEVRNCWIGEIHSRDADAQGIAGWNGPGPFVIDNNEVEASGENVLFGGSDPGIANLVPSDITITNNHIYKPLAWRVGDPRYGGVHWAVKNLLEIKNARRITIDHNIFENNWADAQAGYAINLKSSNQNGRAKWSVCQNLTFTNNIVRHSGSGIGIGRDPFPVVNPNQITIRDNLFEDIDSAKWGGDGVFLLISDATDVTVDHNTVFQSGLVLLPYGPKGVMSDLTFTNNIVAHNAYGVKGGGLDPGVETLKSYWDSSWTFRGNVLVGRPPTYAESLYPPDNFWPKTWADVGFVDTEHGDFSLTADSPYRGAAKDGTDIGYRKTVSTPRKQN